MPLSGRCSAGRTNQRPGGALGGAGMASLDGTGMGARDGTGMEALDGAGIDAQRISGGGPTWASGSCGGGSGGCSELLLVPK